MNETEDLVPVKEYLVKRGFSDVVATTITLHALLSSVHLTVDEIKVLAEEVGYTFSTADAPYLNHKISN
jgi:hypothetical protein